MSASTSLFDGIEAPDASLGDDLLMDTDEDEDTTPSPPLLRPRSQASGDSDTTARFATLRAVLGTSSSIADAFAQLDASTLSSLRDAAVRELASRSAAPAEHPEEGAVTKMAEKFDADELWSTVVPGYADVNWPVRVAPHPKLPCQHGVFATSAIVRGDTVVVEAVPLLPEVPPQLRGSDRYIAWDRGTARDEFLVIDSANHTSTMYFLNSTFSTASAANLLDPHGRGPNVELSIQRRERFSAFVTVRATRAIGAGEELLWDYPFTTTDVPSGPRRCRSSRYQAMLDALMKGRTPRQPRAERLPKEAAQKQPPPSPKRAPATSTGRTGTVRQGDEICFCFAEGPACGAYLGPALKKHGRGYARVRWEDGDARTMVLARGALSNMKLSPPLSQVMLTEERRRHCRMDELEEGCWLLMGALSATSPAAETSADDALLQAIDTLGPRPPPPTSDVAAEAEGAVSIPNADDEEIALLLAEMTMKVDILFHADYGESIAVETENKGWVRGTLDASPSSVTTGVSIRLESGECVDVVTANASVIDVLSDASRPRVAPACICWEDHQFLGTEFDEKFSGFGWYRGEIIAVVGQGYLRVRYSDGSEAKRSVHRVRALLQRPSKAPGGDSGRSRAAKRGRRDGD